MLLQSPSQTYYRNKLERRYEWIMASQGQAPDTAIQVGIMETMEPVYAARAVVDNQCCLGTVQPMRRKVDFLVNGVIHHVRNYQVLCYTKESLIHPIT